MSTVAVSATTATPTPGRLVLVMGISASGKSTIGEAVAKKLSEIHPSESVRFVDADAYHPKSNVEKMAAGHPLNDQDRAEWLRILAQVGRESIEHGETCVLACSALKKAYRLVLFSLTQNLDEAFKLESRLSESHEQQPSDQPTSTTTTNSSHCLVFLSGSHDLLQHRIETRPNHFAKSNLLTSQFETLQPPTPEECTRIGIRFLLVDLDQNKSIDEEAQEIVNWLGAA